MSDNNSLYNKIKKLKKLAERYGKLGFRILPLDGKKPFWEGWSNPELWKNGDYNNDLTLRTLERNPDLNVGIPTGEISWIIAVDVDQPDLLGWNPEPAIKKGALAHTTSKALRLILRSTNPEVLSFSKKLTKKWSQLTEGEREKVINREKYERTFKELKEKLEKGEITQDEFNRKVPTVTIIEILGNGRQFMAPPSIHPTTGIELKWVTPLPDSPEEILSIDSIEELYVLLLECCKNKEHINELFEDYFKQKAREDTGEEGKDADELLEEWLSIILKHLDVAEDKGDYIAIHCPFHKPDSNPSFVIYKNTKLAVDFHESGERSKWKVYRLKELAKALGIELPKGKKSVFEEKIKKFGLDKFGLTADDLKELSVRILDVEEKKDGEVVVKGVKHGEFANWLREKFHFATNSITEEIWRYDDKEGIWKPDGESFIKNICERILNALGYPEFATIRRIAEVVHHIKRHPQITPDQFNRAWREGWVNCKNGVVNIYTKEFRPHNPEFFFTWRINAEYCPDAKGKVVEHFLTTVSEDRELLEEIIAYTLVPGQPFKKFFVLLGPTDSGKSTFIHLIERFLGKENCANVALQQLEKNRFAPSELVGKLANLFADLPPTKLDACPVLKAITGEDTIYVEKKFQKGYFTKIDAKMIFSANMLPEVDESDAFWNRVVIVRFPNRFPKNEKFKEELTKPEELSALLNIALKVIPRLFEKKFESGDINKAVRLWELASDPLSVFIDECIEIHYTAEDDYLDTTIYEFKGDVFDAFKNFCAKYGVESKYATDYNLFVRAFTKKLADRGIRLQEGKKERDGKRLRIWWGIKVKRDDNENEENNETPRPLDDANNSPNTTRNASNTDDIGFELCDALGLGNPQEELLEEVLSEKEESVTGAEEKANEEHESSESKTSPPIIEPSEDVKKASQLYGLRGVNAKLNVIYNSDDTANPNNSASTVKYATVRFYKDCVEFTGVDGKVYGPFKAGDVAKIPLDNIPPLVRGGFAKVIPSEGDSE